MRTIVVMLGVLLFGALGAGSEEIAPTHIRGSVVDDVTGAPLPDAHVVLFAVSMSKERIVGQVQSVRVDIRPGPDGRFEADLKPTWSGPGRVYVVADARGHSEIRPEWKLSAAGRSWDVSPGFEIGQPRVLDLRLKPGPTLSGTVLDEAGQPVVGAQVELTLSGPNWCSWPQSFSMGNGHWPDDTVTDAHGHWEKLAFPIAELSSANHHKDGQFVVTIEHDRYAPVLVPAVERMPQKDHVIEIRSTMRAGRSIEGRVIGTDGKPVPGADITLSGGPRVADPRCHEFTKHVTAAADGRFTIFGLDDREWNATASAPSAGPSEPKKFAAAERGPLELRLTPGGEINGRLRDENGKPISGVQLYLAGPAGRNEKVTTAPDGSFRFSKLPRGKVTIGAYNMFEREVEVPGSFVDVALDARRQVYVKLVSKEDGKPIPPPGNLYFRAARVSWSVPIPSDSKDGVVDAGALYPGTYEIDADVPGRAVTAVRFKLLADKKEPARPTLEVPLGFTLRGQVRDPEGKPVRAAKVHASAGGEDEREATTDDQGIYELKGLNSSHIAIGSGYVMNVEADGFAPWDNVELFMRAGADRRLDVTLDRGVTVRGRVVSSDGRPIEHVEVKVSGKRSFLMTSYYTPASMPSAVTDADGRYVLEHVPLGDVTLVSGSASRTVKVEPGKDLTVDWTL